MRFVRVPYFYLPDTQVRQLYILSNMLLGVIHDVHHDVPNEKWMLPYVKAFMYHPSFIRWVFVKAKKELIQRKFNCNLNLPESVIQLQSRPLAEFVPPTNADLAADVVWLLGTWKTKLFPGGINLPMSYVELAKQHYGYTPQEAARERVDQVPGRSCDADREWFVPQGEEATQIDRNSMGGPFWSSSHA